MAKVLSSSNKGFGVHGGPSGQVGKTSGPARSVGPQTAGQSSQQGSGSAKFASGGSGHMVPNRGAQPQPAGRTSAPAGSSKGMWASGGSTKMQPNRGSMAAQPGKSSAC